MQTAPKRGLLYEVRLEGNIVYLFGTIHVGKAEFFPLALSTVRALAGSAFLAVEADILDQATVTKQVTGLALLPPPTSLDQIVAPALMDRMTRLLEKYQYPKERAIRMRTWMLASTLVTLEAKHSGYDPGWATEAFLLGIAKSRKMPVIELEGLASQFEIYNRLSAAEQAAFLEETMDAIDTGSLDRQTRALADAWASASVGDIEKVRRDMRKSQGTFAKFFNVQMLDERNVAMAARIDEFLRSGKRHFVAVGVLHLVGEKSIIELLRERGYPVREL